MKKVIQQSFRIIVMVANLLIYQSCNQDNLTKDLYFDTCVDRGIFLNECAYKASSNQGTEQEKYLLLLFRALPRNFETFFKMVNGHYMGFVGNTLYATHHQLYSRNPWSTFQPIEKIANSGAEIPRERLSKHSVEYTQALFQRVKEKLSKEGEDTSSYNPSPYGISIKLDDGPNGAIAQLKRIIPPKLYYERMIAMGLGGVWNYYVSDLQLILGRLLTEDIRLVELTLEKYTDDEIASFFYFLFDGPHPEDKELMYQKACYYFAYTYSRNDRLLELLKKAHIQSEIDAKNWNEWWDEEVD